MLIANCETRGDQIRGRRSEVSDQSSGTVQVCAYEHWRAEELGVFQGKDFLRNGAFEVTGTTEGIAADWNVSGPTIPRSWVTA